MHVEGLQRCAVLIVSPVRMAVHTYSYCMLARGATRSL
jgi:hypothetical protein